MSYDLILKEEKRKIISIMKYDYVSLKFSELSLILDNNFNEPRWMDTYILLYKAALPKNIGAYDILLHKLSSSLLKFYFKKSNGRKYLVHADEKMFKEYVWYLTTKQDKSYTFLAQYMPSKEYTKEILRFLKYQKCGLTIKNIHEDEFILEPIGYTFKNEDEARIVYEKLFDAYDLFNTLHLRKSNFINNFHSCLKLGSNKRMLAILSTMISYFNCSFEIRGDVISVPNTNIAISDEITAKAFEAHMMDVYHFYRNVINTKNKKDIVSEVCNKKVSPEIMRIFTANIARYSNIVANNKGLVEWIITISRESKYKLPIRANDDGTFIIENTKISTEQEAEMFYINYMEHRSEHTSLVSYKSSIIGKLRRLFSSFRLKFWKKRAN